MLDNSFSLVEFAHARIAAIYNAEKCSVVLGIKIAAKCMGRINVKTGKKMRKCQNDKFGITLEEIDCPTVDDNVDIMF